jgi:beta-glucanase (GH16 family)
MNHTLRFLLLLFYSFQNIEAQTVDPYLPDVTSSAVIAGKKLVWNDEFNVDGKPNTANWKPETGFVRNNELQYYQLANVNCVGGVCLFTGKRDTVINAKYVRGSTDWRYKDSLAYWTSASLITQGLKTFQYGRIDVRARIDTTYGVWPAIWQKGVSGSWPACGEVDVLEFYNKKIYANAIYGAVGAANYTKCVSKSFTSITGTDTNWVKKFHLWTETWNADTIKLYLDGLLINSVLVSAIANPSGTTPANGFRQAHFFLLNLAIGSNGGTPRAKTSGYTYEVDYIRVYQDDATALNEISDMDVRIFPNPSTDMLNFSSTLEIKKLTIYNLLGAQVMNLKNPQKQVSVSNLSPGIYSVVLTMSDGKSVLKKIIKCY